MSEIKWSDDQLNAIKTKYLKNGKSCNLLVSAAAGSGKTAVLVQRIIEKLVPTDLSKSVDANKLLVVTFTNAAANEMLTRIEKALKSELSASKECGDIERQNLIKRQQLLIQDSEITTIDAFCMRLLRRYFHVLDIAPDFSIADNSQSLLLGDEAMDEIFAELYEEKDADFLNLLCLYATSRSDDNLKTLIREIFNFIVKIPNPLSWLLEKVEDLKYENGIENSLWYKKGLKNYQMQLDFALATTRDALYYMIDCDIDSFIENNPPEKGVPIFDEWKSYYKLFYTCYQTLSSLKSSDFSGANSILADFSFPSLSKLTSKSDEEKDLLKSYRDTVKTALASLKEFAIIDIAQFKKRSENDLYPVALSLYKMVERFSVRFFEKKSKKNLLDFTDVEQLSHKLLSEHPEISEELQDKYEEILMDEYQDTSVLQEEIFKYVTNGSNLFVVGDMKQSIYRFRSSDPTLFKKKLDTYSVSSESENRKITLSQNFRSREEILTGINDVFSGIMSEDAGELNYDDTQKLYLGNKDYKKTNFDYRPECILISPTDRGDTENDDEETFDSITLEARYIASEINRLKSNHFKVSVKSKNGMIERDIQNKDIVILMSSFKDAADIFISELSSAGIDCFVEQSGYFERNEIRFMLSLFKVINNPYCDIPLLSILRSPIFNFTDDELVSIRKCKKGKFFFALKEFINLCKSGVLASLEDIEIARKAENFYKDLNRWRQYSRHMTSDKLVWTLFEETNFYAFVGALFGGDEAQANLRLLFERAKQFEASGFRGLFSFIKYIERIEKNSADVSTAKLIGENHDVVRIMTIHKSKGLEFPVVFIRGGGKKLQKRLDNSKVSLHKDYGLSLDYINFEHNYTILSPSKQVFRSAILAEQTSEEIRKLYVAMTRAKEKLYFVSTLKKNDKALAVNTENGKLSPSYILSATRFLDMVYPAIKNSDNWIIHTVLEKNLTKWDKTQDEIEEKNEISDIDIEKLLNFQYPFSEFISTPTKVSVSQLKSKSETTIIPKPSFLQEKKQSGASYGTLIHTVLEHINLATDMTLSYIESEISRLVSCGILASDEKKMINPQKIFAFYSSDIGKRMLNSQEIHREQQFEVAVPVNYIYPDIKNPQNETILLQGVIDCWFMENDEIVVLDYKTDSYFNIDEIHEKYDKQLELYSFALQKMTKKTIKNKYIYLFFDNSVIEC